ncbi:MULTISPECIES: hypothetical protein [unclassified Variovorax]|uniref:hypothetical protein n=1 Tax=unclassified Variovorax TaxID=663243 RepID=UPI0008382FED|nr:MULTISPECIES: hypothetical protein [unclassified Variovorax]PNG53194.1 hypothetical protein CHC06_04540 [Variovorax sp. B2]PNG53766.1 hypothetical protein CHC07_03587 [Variovorax sp. B4]VTV11220.1 hypothetical protein WDL1CHR_02101 [Variovorax sp. WDL1]
MAHFILTFRIASDSGYQTRYESFVETVEKFAGGPGKVWDQTTSFYVFEAESTAQAVVSHLYLKSAFDSTKDVMVVIDVDRRVKATKGQIEYEVLLTKYLGF